MAEPSSSKQTNNPPLIRASELAHYGFCQRAWWLSTVKKHPTTNRASQARGTAYHQAHLARVAHISRWRRVGVYLWLGGGLILLALTVWLYF